MNHKLNIFLLKIIQVTNDLKILKISIKFDLKHINEQFKTNRKILCKEQQKHFYTIKLCD